jgi:hypothetical protein
MLEVTETQGRDLVLSMQKIGEVEDRKVVAVGEMAAAQLAYFKVRDKDISNNQRGLVDAVHSLSGILARAFASRVPTVQQVPPPHPTPEGPPSPRWAPDGKHSAPD